jgi:hypothetical protein
MVLFDHRSRTDMDARGSCTADYPEEDDWQPETDGGHILVTNWISRYSHSSKMGAF